MATRIKLLSDVVANKIAAGEVVDRPASVVKELVENALDAGATRIEVEVVAGGRKLIAVRDNGCGMSRDDALLCVERHATSKISDVDDIEHIHTMGFRGEAMAAIASVSRFQLVTREQGEIGGTEIVISGGKIQEVNDAGSPEGTEIRVRNLFFNVPARRKFLKTEQTELAHVRQLIHVYALAAPEVAFKLMADERVLYDLPVESTLENRLLVLFSADWVRALRPVDYAAMEMTVCGMLGIPQLARKDRRDQYVFINGRPASAPTIGFAIGEAYKGMLPKGRYPVVFLFITLPPGGVDVNVHPQKREVRFRDARSVRDLVITGLIKALHTPAVSKPTEAGPSGSGAGSGAAASPVSPPPPPESASAGPLAEELSPPSPRAPSPSGTMETGELLPAPQARAEVAPGRQADWMDRLDPSHKGPWIQCRIVGQVDAFVVLETEDGMVIMDPKAAHERVLYEHYMKEVLSANVHAQQLLQPETVTLPPLDAQRVRENLPLLQRMGIGVDEFGGDVFLVDALPQFLEHLHPKDLLADLASTLGAGGRKGGTEHWALERVAEVACRSSVAYEQKLQGPELERLVEDLAKTEMPYTSPRGRPTVIFMGVQELNRRFGRS